VPLWAILDPEERIALVAHELAHNINGDANRGFFVGSAISSLLRWYWILHPRQLLADHELGLLAVPWHLLTYGVSQFIWFWAYGLSHLLWRDSQRAEYLADAHAARVAGTAATLALMEKLHYEHTFVLALQRTALGHEERLFAAFRERIARMPQHELVRLKRVQQLELSRLDVTHPPTAYRIARLQAHPTIPVETITESADMERVAAEAAELEADIERNLVEVYTNLLYA
jgi:Zn-dependent protease with chaperone function